MCTDLNEMQLIDTCFSTRIIGVVRWILHKYFGPEGAITSTEARCGESNNVGEKANQFLLTPLNQMVARANRILRRMAPLEGGTEE